MFIHKISQNYWYFSRMYEQFNLISSLILGVLDKDHEVSESAQKSLRQLDKKREACQNAIGCLNLPSFADCKNCGGKCCDREPDFYFSPIDFWLTKYNKGYIHLFSETKIKPPRDYYISRIRYLLDLIKAQIKLLIKKIIAVLLLIIPLRTHQKESIKKTFRLNSSKKINTARGRCLYLGDNGCKLTHPERPIICLIYACPSLKKSMDDKTRTAYIKAIKELYDISLKTFDILKAEAGYPKNYGYAILKLII